MSLSLSERPRCIPFAAILGLALLAAAPLRAGVNRWTSIGPYGGGVTALAFSANGHTAWAGTKKLGVFRSSDNGRTWTAASRGLSGEVLDLAASPAEPGRVYAATSFGIFRSDDAGWHWTAANAGLPSVNGAFLVATEPTDPAAVWAAFPKRRALYRSTNLGAQWRQVGQGLKGGVWDVAVHPKTAGVVFAATDRGLFRSADSGAHWSPSGLGLRGLMVSRVVFDLVQPRHLYAITLEEGVQSTVIATVFVSDDGGASWKGASERPERPPSYGSSFELAVDAAHAGTAWLSSNGSLFSVFKTTDGGQHWRGVLRRTNPTAALAANPLRPGTVLAGQSEPFTAGEPALFRSDDRGTSWSPSDTGIAAQIVHKVVPDPSKPGALYAQGLCCSLWKRTGAGQPFTPIPTGIDYTSFTELILDPKTPSTLYLAADSVYKSVDAGATWQPLSSPAMDSIALDPAHPSTLYGASRTNDAIYRSDDGGFSWHALSGSAGLHADLVTVTGTAVYAHDVGDAESFRDRLLRSTDGGATWTTLLERNPEYALVKAVAEDPRDPQRLWTAFVFGAFSGLPPTGGVYRSTDGGTHWSLSRVEGNRAVFALAVDPRNSNRIWAASAGAVFLSEDGGATWVSSGEDLPAVDILDLRLDPFDPDTLYAGTEGGSVYVYTRGGGPR